jgi:hypothetical protein
LLKDPGPVPTPPIWSKRRFGESLGDLKGERGTKFFLFRSAQQTAFELQQISRVFKNRLKYDLKSNQII